MVDTLTKELTIEGPYLIVNGKYSRVPCGVKDSRRQRIQDSLASCIFAERFAFKVSCSF